MGEKKGQSSKLTHKFWCDFSPTSYLSDVLFYCFQIKQTNKQKHSYAAHYLFSLSLQTLFYLRACTGILFPSRIFFRRGKTSSFSCHLQNEIHHSILLDITICSYHLLTCHLANPHAAIVCFLYYKQALGVWQGFPIFLIVIFQTPRTMAGVLQNTNLINSMKDLDQGHRLGVSAERAPSVCVCVGRQLVGSGENPAGCWAGGEAVTWATLLRSLVEKEEKRSESG